MQRLPWIFAASLLGAACGNDVETPSGAGGAGGTGAQDELPCALSEMLAARCQQCHAAEPQFGAPMPLVTRADLMATAVDGVRSVAEAAVARMSAETGRMPQPPQAAATAAEIALVADWIEAGHPSRGAGEMCDGGGGSGGGGTVDCEPDVELTAEEPFEMPASSIDEQICFGITIPASDDKRHITAIAPRIDNNTIIHHMLLLQAPSPVSSSPSPCAFTQVDWKLLYAWGPGTPPHVLPDAAGFPLEAGEEAHFVLQLHYNNLQGLVGETDQSGIDLCTTTTLREHDADIMAFGGTGFQNLAPMATSTLACTSNVPAALGAYFPISVFQSWPHMHTLGASLYGAVERGNQTEVLVDVPDYDFEYQITYPNDAVQIDVGDDIVTRCTWDNTTASPVGFGEGTNDEMCFNFVSYYPRIAAPVWSWLLPAQTASCDLTP